jgi:hypothetical protein
LNAEVDRRANLGLSAPKAIAAVTKSSRAALAIAGRLGLVEVELRNLPEQHIPCGIGVSDSIARWRQGWRPRRQCETPKDPSGHSRVGDRRENSHPSATFRAAECVDLENALKEFSPGNAALQNRFHFVLR